MNSLQSFILKRYMRQLQKRARKLAADFPAFRRAQDDLLADFPLPGNTRYKDMYIGDCPAEQIIPGRIRHPHKVLYYLHGGGYCSGSIRAYRSLIARLAQRIGVRAVAIDYRLAPEHPYPAALEDALTGYRWLLEKEHFHRRDIIVAGDSSGAGLLLAMLQRARDEGLPQPLAALLLSPWVDLACTSESMQNLRDKEALLPPELPLNWAQRYADGASLMEAGLSPLYGDLKGLPPMIIQAGGHEILRGDAERLAREAQRDEVEVSLQIWEGMPHLFQYAWRMLPEARRANKDLAEFVRAHIEENEARLSGIRPDFTHTNLKGKVLRVVQLSLSTVLLGTEILKGLLEEKDTKNR